MFRIRIPDVFCILLLLLLLILMLFSYLFLFISLSFYLSEHLLCVIIVLAVIVLLHFVLGLLNVLRCEHAFV